MVNGIVSLCVILLLNAASLASKVLPVMVVDFGSENLKVAVLSRGAHHHFELALNEQAARKSDSIVAFADGKRYFNIMAKNAETRLAANAVKSVALLLNRSADDALLREPVFRFNSLTTDRRGVVAGVRIDGAEEFAVEVLAAMMLDFLAQIAHAHAGVAMKHAVIIASDERQRTALRLACSIANLKPLALVRDTHAVALAYAVEHGSTLDADVERVVLLVDIGATLTRVTLARATRSSLHVLAARHDEALAGGRYVDAALVELACATLTCARSATARVRLLRDAQRVKHVLSVNKDATLRVPLDG